MKTSLKFHFYSLFLINFYNTLYRIGFAINHLSPNGLVTLTPSSINSSINLAIFHFLQFVLHGFIIFKTQSY